MITGVLGIWCIVNQRYVLTFLCSFISLIYHTSIQETLNHGPFDGHIISFDLLPKVCAPTSSIQIVISLAQQVIINHSTSPSPSTFPPSSTFHCIFMYHMYTIPPQIDPVRM